MIDSKDLFSYSYYTYGEPFTGSHDGMRYRLSVITVTKEEAETKLFEAAAWPEPYSESATDPGLIRKETFSFTEEGKEEAVSWLNEMYATRQWSARHWRERNVR